MAPAKKFPCILCNTEVGGKSGGVQCSYCDRWVHPKCANISKAHFELYKLPTCQYVCETCVKISSKIKKEIQHLQIKQAEMRSDIDANKEEISATKKRVEKVEKKVEELDPAKIIEQSRDEMLRELRERESRKDNLIFHQVEEPTMGRGVDRKEHDMKMVMDILDFLQCPTTREEIKFIFRAGERREDRPGPRPIIICLKSTGARNRILENTRKLAASSYDRISITPDLTPLQRKEAEARNNAMDQEEQENYHWVLVGMKGQRSLIKRRKHYQQGPPRGGGEVARGPVRGRGRAGARGRGTGREVTPSQGTVPGAATARQIAMAEGEKERERVMELVRETQGTSRKEVEKNKNKSTEESTEPAEPTIILGEQEEPSGIMEMEGEDEDGEEVEDGAASTEETSEDEGNQTEEQDTVPRGETRKQRKRNRGDTSLSPPQTNQKKKQ